MTDPGEVTRLLIDGRNGNAEALGRLFELVYGELGRIAHRQLQRLRVGDTIDTAALVHEAYLRLAEQTRLTLEDRVHFFAAAARAMRFILVDYARARSTGKRGGGVRPLGLDDVVLSVEDQAEQLLAIDEALAQLGTLDQRLVQLVEYRFFCGLTEEETAALLGVASRTVRRDWTKAKILLYEWFMVNGQ